MMQKNRTPFDPEICHRAYRDSVAPVYGDATGPGRLDERVTYYFQLLHGLSALSPGMHLVDLGCGTTAFGAVARALKMEVTLVDDFGGGGGVEADTLSFVRRLIEGLKSQLAIRVIEQDFVIQPLPIESATVDVVTAFHSLEHWHHSPKRLFREISRVLKPGGFVFLATPNAANLRKRISVPLGKNNWSTLEEWYHDGDPIFRGHVREPIVRDLQRLLEWNDFEIVVTEGRNFIGRESQALGFLPKPVVHCLACGSDYLLRFFPTLCSDIHVIGRKRA